MGAPLSDSELSLGSRESAARLSAIYGQCFVMTRADDPDTARANRQLKADIDGGATGVAIIFEGSHNAFGFGLPANAASIEQLFDGVDLAGLHIRIDNHPHGQALTEKCVEFLQKRRIDPKLTKITFGIDPAATLATTGRLKMSIAALKASMPQSMSAFFSSGLPGIFLEADGRPFHNAGASRAQELGAMLSAARSHLQMAESGRHHIAYALPHIGFATALDQDPVQGIVKLHVLQKLWRKLQREYNIESPFSAPIHVESSMRMMTTRDCLTNTTRTAAAAFAAIAGGATSVSILPYSQPLGLPNAQARRQARNCPLVFLREISLPESLYGKILAPNKVLVEKLAVTAWEEFQLFEQQGGILQSLINGKLQSRINEAEDLTIASYLKGEPDIIGTTEFCTAETKKIGIYEQDLVKFVPQGLEHCTPLSFRRLDSLFEEARANAPSDTY